MTPTARTLAECRRVGWEAAVAEKWIEATKQRKDLFGFIDVVALTGSSIVGIQATSGGEVSRRVEKIRSQCREQAEAWLDSGGLIEVWGWRKYARPVDRKYWRVRKVVLTREDL